MKHLDKSLKFNSTQFLLTGIALTFPGVFCAYILFLVIPVFPIEYLPISLLASLLAYFLVNKIDSGGQLNIYNATEKKTEGDKQLYDLVKKYRNKNLISITAIILVLILVAYELYYHAAYFILSADLITSLFVLVFVSVLGITTGVKYFSSWLSIVNYYKKS